MSSIQKFYDSKKLDQKVKLDIKLLKDKKIIGKKFIKLKILGTGELKEKINITTNFISKQALTKAEKVGCTINILKK